jgi:dynactin complex subunit
MSALINQNLKGEVKNQKSKLKTQKKNRVNRVKAAELLKSPFYPSLIFVTHFDF